MSAAQKVTIGDATLYEGFIFRGEALRGLLCSLPSSSPADCLSCFRSHGEQFPSALKGDQDATPLKRDVHAFDGLRRAPWMSVLHNRLHRVTSLLCKEGGLRLERLQAHAASIHSFLSTLFLEIGKEQFWLCRSRKRNSINGQGGLLTDFFQRKTEQQVVQNEDQTNQEFGESDYFLRCM